MTSTRNPEPDEHWSGKENDSQLSRWIIFLLKYRLILAPILLKTIKYNLHPFIFTLKYIRTGIQTSRVEVKKSPKVKYHRPMYHLQAAPVTCFSPEQL